MVNMKTKRICCINNNKNKVNKALMLVNLNYTWPHNQNDEWTPFLLDSVY